MSDQAFDQAVDYVIVGAESAGSVLADRLSADGRHQVLVCRAMPRSTPGWRDRQREGRPERERLA